MPHPIALAGLAIAVTYLPMTDRPSSALRSVWKTVPVAALALAAWISGGPALLVAALFLSALGDFALSRDGEAAFLYGLSSFALSHLVYILHILAISGLMPWEGFAQIPLAAIVLAGITISTELWLIPHTGAMKWPVRAYVVIILTMGLSALTLPWAAWPAILGAGLFTLSDLILSVELFRLGPDHRLTPVASKLVWITYIGAQAGLFWGLGGLG